jgi:protease YdgD
MSRAPSPCVRSPGVRSLGPGNSRSGRRLMAPGAILACASLFLALTGCTSLPGLGPEAVRTPVDIASAPWSALGPVLTEVGGRCTGALIGPQTVLTAAHCLISPQTLQFVPARSIHFLIGYSRDGYAGHARAVSFTSGQGFAVGPGVRPLPTSPADADWAVVTLDTALGTPDRVLPLARVLPRPGIPLALGGYQADQPLTMVADLHCATMGLARDAVGRIMLRHSCAATRGASGSPLLVRGRDGTWGVVGITSLSRFGVSGGYAVLAASVDPLALTAPR